MFDLERAISGWREQFTAKGLASPDLLDELESHLREDVRQQERSGLSPQQAFNTALQRFGESTAINAEFKKIAGWPKVLEGLMRLASVILVLFIVSMSGYTFLQMELSPSEQIVAYAGVVCTLFTVCAWRYAVPFVPVLAGKAKRIAVGWVCIASGFVLTNLFCHFVLPQFENQDRQLPALGFWAVFPIALLACLGLALMMSADDREHWKMGQGGLRNAGTGYV